MELNLHAIATQCFVSGRPFAEGDRVVSYLVRETSGEVARRDVLESQDPPPVLRGYGAAGPLPGASGASGGAGNPGGAAGAEWPPAFIFCRWVVAYRTRRGEDSTDRALKLTAENLFVTLADPAAEPNEANTPLLQFLALMLERKKLIKPRGLTESGERQVYEHMKSHQLYEVPVGTLDDAFFMRIQEHLDVLVGAPKAKAASAAPSAAPVAAPVAPAS